MKILMVNKFLHLNGGSETYVFSLGDYLKSQGHEVEYFGMDHEKRVVSNRANVYMSQLDFHAQGFKKLVYPFKIIYSVEARRKIRQVLESFEPQVVHLNNFNFQLTPSIIYEIRAYGRKRHQPLTMIYTAHDYQLVCPNHMMKIPSSNKNCDACLSGNYAHCVKNRCIHNSLVKSFLGAFEGFLYRKLNTYSLIDAVICPSYFMETQLQAYPDLRNKTTPLHNFIMEIDKTPEEKEPYILYFGRYSEEKGIKTLLEVCSSLPHIQFVFAGSGPLESRLEGYSNIQNVGFLTGDSLKRLIRKAKFSIYPSEWYENCPFSIMESQIMGTPVIGANIGGIPELISEGFTGDLFISGDSDDLKNKILHLWNDAETLKRYTENCLNHKFLSLSEYAEKLMDIYQSTSD